MKALLFLSFLVCAFLPKVSPVSDEEAQKPSSVTPLLENQGTVLNPNSPTLGVVEESGVDERNEEKDEESSQSQVPIEVPPAEKLETGVPAIEERTLESPRKALIPIRRLDTGNETGVDATYDISREADLTEFYPVPELTGNYLDNTTIKAEESVHNTYTTHPQPRIHEHAHSQGTGYGNALPQQHQSHVKPLKESVVHRDPHDHFDQYDVIRTQDHDNQHHQHHPHPPPQHHQPSYGHHQPSHGSGHGQSYSSHSHGHGSGRGYGSFQPYHYDTHEIPECARTRHYHNVTYCLEDHYYPTETILWAIQQSGHYARRLLSDVTYQSADNLVDGLTRAEEERMTYSHYYGGGSDQQHQQSDKYRAPWSGYSYNQDYYKSGGYLCPSNIYYGRPRRAMNTYGKWKVIVNLDHPPKQAHGHGHHHPPPAYTQTLRLEHCIYANSPCSYVDSHYHSRCLQKHNFVRLVAWTYEEGLHVDNFKLPIACSCHVQQPSHYYTPQPQTHSHHKHQQTPAPPTYGGGGHGQQQPAAGYGQQQQQQGKGQGIHAVHQQVLTGIHQGKQKLINSLLG